MSRKIYLNCPRCRTRLNSQVYIGDVGICQSCGWAGSIRSENSEDWSQFKVSALLIAVGLTMSYFVLAMSGNTNTPAQLFSKQLLSNQLSDKMTRTHEAMTADSDVAQKNSEDRPLPN